MIIAIMAAVGALTIFLGWGVHKKKWYFLISGYNTLSKEEQAKVDVEGLAKVVGISCYIIGILLILLGLTIHYDLFALSMIITALLIIVPIGLVFYNLKKYPESAGFGGQKSPKAKKISMILSAVTFVIVAVVIYFSVQPTEYNVTDEQFSISGSYGEDMPWDEITDLTLIEELPKIAVRTNGSSVGSKSKGNFKFENGEKVKLFVDKSVKRFIVVEWNGKKHYLNQPTIEETEELYNEMKKHWEK